MPIVKLREVHKAFRRGSSPAVHAVNGVSLTINRGETLAVIGESGSGKSTVGRLAVGLHQPDSGSVHFGETDLGNIERSSLRRLRRRMAVVFQEPLGSLNPMMTIGQIVEEPLAIHERGLGREARRDRACEALEQVSLDSALYSRKPGRLSGGQQQRVGIARAIITQPDFVVLDEPTSSLDLSIQAGILQLLGKLQEDLGLAYLYISHDLASVDFFSDRVAVMYLGQIVELGPKQSVLDHPRHPYTEALLSASLSTDPDVRLEQMKLRGEIPSAVSLPQGCVFYSRCPYRSDPRCAEERPLLREVAPGHFVATFYEARRDSLVVGS
jgi:oligopeptide/dipeptide ABC transporter ATP-binding protein